MTIDKAQLKALAEALIKATDAWHKNEQDNELGDMWHVADDNFTEACTPTAVLAMLAEIERLEDGEQVADELCAQLSGLLDQIATIVRGPALPAQRHGYGDLPFRVKTVIADRNTLRTELAGLRTGYDAQNNVIADLKAENEALRTAMKDLCAMYTHVWDREDGALVCFSSNVERFDKAHEAAWALLTGKEASHG